MQRISGSLTNDWDGNQPNYKNDLPVIGNKNYALQKPFETNFLTVIGNAKPTVIRHLLSSLRLWPKAHDFAL